MQPSGSILNFLQPQQRAYHLFVSHSWDYGEDRTNLGSLIVRGLNSTQVFDYSAPANHPIHAANQKLLVQALVERITKANILIFPAGVYASYSRWITIEIAIAQQLQKPIIAVEKWGSQRSSSMVTAAHEIVAWNSNSIATAINRWHLVQYAS